GERCGRAALLVLSLLCRERGQAYIRWQGIHRHMLKPDAVAVGKEIASHVDMRAIGRLNPWSLPVLALVFLSCAKVEALPRPQQPREYAVYAAVLRAVFFEHA